jgi:predicted nucleotidyltransferase
MVNFTTSGQTLETLLGSKLRAKLLGWLLTHPTERFFVRQLKGLLNEDATNLSRELTRLQRLGILLCYPEGKQKYYQANQQSPLFPELRGLVLKTSGLADQLREGLEPFKDAVQLAFIYGSMAAGTMTAESDVDLMVIGSCGFRELTIAVHEAQHRIGREINFTVYSEKEFREKIAEKHSFIETVLREPKIFLIGEADELGRLAEQ